MKKMHVSYPIIVLTYLFLIMYFDRTGTVRIGLLAAILHEMGHIAVWIKISGKMPRLDISITGIGLDTSGIVMSAKQNLALAAAGPLVNFFLFGVCLLYKNWHSSYWCSYFEAANFLLGLFNLIPIGCLDGRQIIQALFKLCLHLKHK